MLLPLLAALSLIQQPSEHFDAETRIKDAIAVVRPVAYRSRQVDWDALAEDMRHRAEGARDDIDMLPFGGPCRLCWATAVRSSTRPLKRSPPGAIDTATARSCLMRRLGLVQVRRSWRGWRSRLPRLLSAPVMTPS